MAKLPQGIFGPIIGKVGPVVGAKWKDISYVRSRASKSVKPPTLAQLSSRGKFKFINKFFMPFHSYLSIGLMNKAKSMTPLNVAYSMNHKQMVQGTYPNFTIDYSEFRWSEGSLPTLIGLQVEKTDVNVLKLTWEQDNRRSTVFNDQVMLLIYCPALKLTDGFLNGVNRADKHCNFSINPKFAGHEVEVYISLCSLNRKKIAHSQYLGRFPMF